ncbi:MAG TPA: hypothetical protein HPP77_04345 [Candidatus Hydrogenedentes bacterium]|nr:hypothetical protein [Candidatus Hydrogenedentota bacterium]HIJ73281.1 hypothetical protein [Candidatus Hydrogenedentota bacterium]
MGNDGSKDNFGCKGCWPPSAEAAWEARGQLRREDPLIDESHYIVAVLTCSACAQRFISIFTEEIDWVDGDDPQYWTLMPLTQQEATDLGRRDGSLSVAALKSLASDRRSLRRDYPKGVDEPRLYWATGV